MSLTAVLTNDFASNPPNEINFNCLDDQCLSILESLELATGLLATSSKEATVRQTINILKKHWPRVWVWLAALSKAFLKTSRLTSLGQETCLRLTQVAKTVFTYPMHAVATARPGEIPETKLKPLLDSTPEILALAAELWLCASAHDLGGSAEAYLHVVGRMLDAQGMVPHPKTGMSYDSYSGRVMKELVNAVHWQRGSWDVPGTLIKTIIRQLDHLSSESFRTVYYAVAFVNCLLREPQMGSLPLSKLISHDAIRWVGAFLRRTVSDSVPATLVEIDSTPRTRVVVECLVFFSFCLAADALFAIQVVETGVLFSIFKARDLLIHDAIINSPNDSHTIACESLLLFSALSKFSIYRPVLVRLVPWVNRVQSRRIDTFDDRGLVVCQSFLTSWDRLKELVSLRRSRKNQVETRAIRSKQKICENQEIGRQIREGYFSRLPRALDFIFIKDQFVSDLYHLNDWITQHFKSWSSKTTTIPIIWIDYNGFPLIPQAQSLEDSTKRLDELGWTDPATYAMGFRMESEVLGVQRGCISAVAVVPGMKKLPLVIGIARTWDY
ncbi:hypothetical protein V5O48_017020 [Marasmius crinis-equi]|uniref:Uncharacterized protein n=1 Tax=Marasmius crinis-equi TaxID=585013 RepID=A0ABR3EQ49_9AGAR